MARKKILTKKWIATMSAQGRITIPKDVRDRAGHATYWVIRPLKKGFEAIPFKE